MTPHSDLLRAPDCLPLDGSLFFQRTGYTTEDGRTIYAVTGYINVSDEPGQDTLHGSLVEGAFLSLPERVCEQPRGWWLESTDALLANPQPWSRNFYERVREGIARESASPLVFSLKATWRHLLFLLRDKEYSP